jgi:hypothetical protein
MKKRIEKLFGIIIYNPFSKDSSTLLVLAESFLCLIDCIVCLLTLTAIDTRFEERLIIWNNHRLYREAQEYNKSKNKFISK